MKFSTHVRSTTLVAGLMLITLAASPQRIDLSKEQVGKPPATFAPMVGTWLIAQDGGDKVVMVDGRPWVASTSGPRRRPRQERPVWA